MNGNRNNPDSYFHLEQFRTILGWRLQDPANLFLKEATFIHALHDGQNHPVQGFPAASAYATSTTQALQHALHEEAGIAFHHSQSYLLYDPHDSGKQGSMPEQYATLTWRIGHMPHPRGTRLPGPIPYQDLRLHIHKPLTLKPLDERIGNIVGTGEILIQVWQYAPTQYALDRMSNIKPLAQSPIAQSPQNASPAPSNAIADSAALERLIPSAWLLEHDVEESIRAQANKSSPHETSSRFPKPRQPDPGKM